MSRCRFSSIFAATLLLATAAHGAGSPLADAAARSDRGAIERLLADKADVGQSQADGMTALHWAARLDDVASARLLVAAKADANATNRYGVTPLSLACENGNAAMVELLLNHGANPNASLRGGETALMTAARVGKVDVVKLLLARGADVNAKERRGQTAVMWAASDGHAEVVEELIKAGADFRAALPDSGFTPLLFAARDGRAEVVAVLLKAGADVKEVMQPRKTGGRAVRPGTGALMLAIENGHFELALDLIRAGADPNDQRSGFSPLHVMTWVRKPNRGEDDGDPAPQGSGSLSSLDFIRKLVAAGADVNAPLKSGKGSAAQYNRKGATPFLMASATADVAYMRLLVELGADPRAVNADGTTALIAACGLCVGSAAANEIAGEEPEVLEAAELCLKLGIDINAVDANGESAMHAAAYKNMPRVLQFLVDRGARVDGWNRKNRHGWTPLLIAEGHRPGNFKPSAETAAAIRALMQAGGVTPPEPAAAKAPVPAPYPSEPGR